MFKKNSKKIVIFLLLILGGFFVAHFVGAQDYGTNAVSNGLNGSLGGAGTDLRTIIARIINIALGFLGIVAVGIILYGGFLWMTSNGDEEKITKAKNLLKSAVIGLIIILASWAIATFIISRLGGAINGGGGNGCTEGTTSSCGCGGYMTCAGGAWGGCIGSDCSCPGCGPTSCNLNPNSATCSPVLQICATGNYCDPTSCLCLPQGSPGQSCNLDTTGATCQADNNRCGAYLTCSPTTCLCVGTPVITGISPVGGFCSEDRNKACTQDSDCFTTCNLSSPNGAADNFLTISGKSFGTYSATGSQVVFLGSNNPQSGVQPTVLNPACINSWTDEQIVIAVPASAGVGPLKVINKDNFNDTTNNDYGPKIPDFEANSIARPGLCYLSPDRGLLSAPVGYQGINLYSGSAYFGNYQSNVHGLNSQFSNPNGLDGTSSIPNLRAGDSGSFVINNINGHREPSNFLRFIKNPEQGEGPYIISFTPTSGSAGQYVTIRGSGFGGARGLNHVYFSSVATTTEASYDFPEVCLNSVWRNDQIIVKVPAGLADNDYSLKISLGTTTIDTQNLNPNVFTADKNLALRTSLCKIDPVRGPATTPVTLWGEYFGRLDDPGIVEFSGQASSTGTIAQDGRANMIQTAVPDGAITGPVHVIDKGKWGNELNFFVGTCHTNSDCGQEICCPDNTYKKGRCAVTLNDCFINIPTSVFEWNFSTGFGPNIYSCAGGANYFGSCQDGSTCPNVPGTCSPYSGGTKVIAGDCDSTCASVAGCKNFAPDNCTYDSASGRCLKNGSGASCDLAQDFSYTYISGNKTVTATTTKICNANQQWEITFAGRCPDGWTKAAGNRCVSGSCATCDASLTCTNVASSGRCASAPVCPAGATCEVNAATPSQDKCFVFKQPSCDCCCQIGQSARDCCGGLQCEGTCGSDTGKTSGATLGRCGGCKSAGSTPAQRDAACSCTGHSGQYCDINNPQFPDGVCNDCTALTKQDCTDHSSACCLDANKTPAINDDVCRGGNGQLLFSDPGYCAFYNCSATDPAKCASNTPVKIGDYPSINNCTTGCAQADPCSGITTMGACLAKDSRCCFDAKASSTPCRLGGKITGGTDAGYCAYYNCQSASSTPPGDPKLCASSTPLKLGAYPTIANCDYYCAHQPQGAGLSCAGVATSTCQSDICNFPGFACLLSSGSLGTTQPDCGTCCCQPGTASDACTAINPSLKCLADKGSCSGASRGLCCGCTQDSECGSPSTIGCGSDTCCQARPQIASTTPAHMATNVCRNAVLKINFDQGMDISSFADNILVMEERDYGSGVCPAGTFITDSGTLQELLAAKNANFLTRLYQKVASSLRQVARRFSGNALADTPNPAKLYCSISGSVSSEQAGNKTSLVFEPLKILSPSTNYYVVVKGDEGLNSQSGVQSLAVIGFNGLGYFDQSTGTYVLGEAIKFNNHAYKNSQIFKFTTLSDQGPKAGICAVDHVTVSPSSYLFKTVNNDLNENDKSPSNKTFDTQADKDKVFAAWAYSSDNQALQPITGYFWDWNWQITDPGIAAISPVVDLPVNESFVSAQASVTDGQTQITAKVDMTRFLNASCNNSSACVCADETCPLSCCNVYSTGNQISRSGDIYVFICNNPWPPIDVNGQWAPWYDANSNCLPNTGACGGFNYKFYYCRDSGTANTLDDLPAITSQAVTRGQSSALVCSDSRTPCSNLNVPCGTDQNGDGIKDGLCIWDILKESYFFRETIPGAGEIIDAVDQETSGAVKVTWDSSADQVASYKIYYLKSGQGSMLVKPVSKSACTLSGNVYHCSMVINNLTNDQSYIFKVSVISVNQTESQLSNEKTAVPTDKTPPAVPGGLQYNFIGSSTLQFTWSANSDEVALYRLYHGLSGNQYGESFDSNATLTSLSLDLSQFPTGVNYFALAALDAYNNESQKSPDLVVTVPTH